MASSRLEAFSDGVLAIVITVMVLEIGTPSGEALADFWREAGVPLLTYLLSFVYVGIYWNNHHHLMQLAEHVDGRVLWANLHLLFWLSLVPLTTRWMNDTGLSRDAIVVYGVDLLACAIAYELLQRLLVSAHGPDSLLARTFEIDWKGALSLVLYVAGVLLAALAGAPFEELGRIGALVCFGIVAALWLLPDRRVERALAETSDRAATPDR